jgi:hypothetical protein
LYAWTDHDGDLEDAVELDSLLTNITLYLTDTLTAGAGMFPLGIAFGIVVTATSSGSASCRCARCTNCGTEPAVLVALLQR